MTFSFFVGCLVILCFFVSIIYAMTTCDSPQETVKEDFGVLCSSLVAFSFSG